MVDALSRAARWITPGGCVIDLRPADVVAEVEIGLPDGSVVSVGGLTVDAERRARHCAADEAVADVTSTRLFRVDREERFQFYYYPDSPDQLREYIAAKWRHSRLDDSTYHQAGDLLRAHPEGRLWLREEVGIRCLLP